MSDKYEIQIPMPEQDVFAAETGDETTHLFKGQPQPVFMFDHVEYPAEGGIYVHLQGLKYPTKGFPTPQSVQANNIVKRFFIGQLRMLARNPIYALSLLIKKNRLAWMGEFNQVGVMVLGPYLLKRIRYSKTAREMIKLTETFLLGLGFENTTFATILGTLFEYDNAYMFRFQDLMNETTKEALLKDPGGEMRRLIGILKERDPNRKDMHIRFESAFKLLNWAMKIPRVKKLYTKVIEEMDLSQLQMDDGDRYHVLRWNTYDFFGEPFEVRGQRFIDIHNGKPPQAYIIQT